MHSSPPLLKQKERNPKKAILTLHHFFCENGLDTHQPAASRLVSMFAHSGSLSQALQAFEKLPFRDTASWSSIVIGFVDHGHLQYALSLYQKKIHGNEGISLNNPAISALLTASCILKDVELLLLIHDLVCTKGLFTGLDVYASSALISMYAKCGHITMAKDVFDQIAIRNVVSWNALMVGYIDCGHGEEAIYCFEKMQEEGIFPSEVTFVCILKACSLVQDVAKGYKLHTKIVEKGLNETNAFIGSSLVSMYMSFELLKTAQQVFEKLPIQDAVSWNTLISGLVEHGIGEDAFQYFHRMRSDGISPTSVTYVSILKACTLIDSTMEAQKIHSEIVKNGLETESYIGRALLVMYSKQGILSEAEKLFYELKIKDVISWTAFIAGCVETGHNEKALSHFEEMQVEGIVPDCVTFVCGMKACGSIGASFKGREMHVEVIKKGLEKEINIGNTLINMYAEFGLLLAAQQVFDDLPSRNLISWNVLMSAYAQLGESEKVFQIFDTMIAREGLYPDMVAILSVFNACNHGGLVEIAQKFFETLADVLCFNPSVEHYACMIDLLGRAGLVNKAIAMLDNVPSRPNSSFWHTILGACQKWGDVELGRHAFNHAMRMDENDVALYVYMLNIYSRF